jgi:hypothetical protein
MAKKKTISNKTPKVFELTITLQDTSPLVWRKILTHEFIALDELHMLIQITMGWENSHLFDFRINKKIYADRESALEMNTLPMDGLQLCDVLGDTKKFIYTYDFGDGWVHEIKVSKTLDHDPRMNYPACIGGENACPPEDCGGIPGFEDLKSTLAGKESQEKDELLTWLGGFYNPTTFDPNFVNKYLLWTENDLDSDLT